MTRPLSPHPKSRKAKSVAKECKRIHADAASGDATNLPEASGTFTYAHWLVVHKLSGTELQVLGQTELRVGSVCSGMSTETVALEALKRVAPPFRYDAKLVCELEPAKLKYLRKLHPTAHHSKGVRDLKSESDLVTRPPLDVLFAGISCKSVSKLNMTPDSVLSMKGSTGQTLSGLRYFVLVMPFEVRPKVILLENVAA